MRNATRARTDRQLLLVPLAAAVLLGCASNDPGKPATRRQELASGYAAFEQRRYEEAMQAADRVLKEDSVGPGSAEALYLQGRVHEQNAQTAGSTSQAREHLRSARAVYQRALAAKPAQPLEAYLRAGLANASYFLEDYATAAREWAAAYPHMNDADAKAWVLYRAGLAEQRQGQFQQADRHFAEAQQLFPGSEPARRAATHQGAAGFYVQVGTFANKANAEKAAGMLKAQGHTPVKATDPAGRQTIAVGPVTTYQHAKSLRDRLAGQYPEAVIVP